jgi:MOSC domain-containing protein YiiM
LPRTIQSEDQQIQDQFTSETVEAWISIRHLYISPAHNFFGHHGQQPGNSPNIEVDEIECLAGRGIRGDRFLDYQEGYKGQITFFSIDTFEEVCRDLGVDGLSPAVVRRNAITEGIDLNRLIGERFRVQGVEFEGVCECKPCYWMDYAIAPGAESRLQGKGGLRARILSAGTLRVVRC